VSASITVATVPAAGKMVYSVLVPDCPVFTSNKDNSYEANITFSLLQPSAIFVLRPATLKIFVACNKTIQQV
jgi:hypothetical protein